MKLKFAEYLSAKDFWDISLCISVFTHKSIK